MTSNWEPKTLIDLAQRNWHKPIGLIFTIAAGILFAIILLSSVKAPPAVSVIVYSMTAVATIIIWFYNHRLPRTQKGKVGFVVCIHCTDENEEKIIREDFVKTLRNLLKGGRLGHTFHFIEIPNHLSQNINDVDDAHTLRQKTKSHFLIFGRVRLRSLGGKSCHILDLNGIVSHKPIAKEISEKLSKEFGELFPKRLHISTENDLLSLNFTSDWTECVAKYIIGIAAACSSDINYAENLYSDVEAKLKSINTDFPIFVKLKQRLPKRFSELYIAKAKTLLSFWRRNNDDSALEQFILNVNKISDELSNIYDVLLLRSIAAFLNGRRINEAIDHALKCKSYNDPVWHFNLAFLYAYERDLKKSIRHYRICANYDISPITLSEIEDFIVWLVEVEPDKYQFYFCLGFFNWKIKGDSKQSINDFEKFIANVKNGEFSAEKALAEQWIGEIMKEPVEPSAAL